ncbi:DUF3953 domain-containing protein [Bacillus cereus]
MLKGIRITVSLIAFSIEIYGFFNGSSEIIPYMFISLGVMALTISLEEILKRQTGGSVLALLAGAAALFIDFTEIF